MKSDSDIARQRQIEERIEVKRSKAAKERSNLFYKTTLCAIYDFFYVFKLYSRLIKEEEDFYGDECFSLLTEEEVDTLLEEVEKAEEILERLKKKINSSKG